MLTFLVIPANTLHISKILKSTWHSLAKDSHFFVHVQPNWAILKTTIEYSFKNNPSNMSIFLSFPIIVEIDINSIWEVIIIYPLSIFYEYIQYPTKTITKYTHFLDQVDLIFFHTELDLLFEMIINDHMNSAFIIGIQNIFICSKY